MGGELAADSRAAEISPDVALTVNVQPPASSLDLSGMEEDASDAYWRREVAARLERYRSRRKPRAPRYPSLRLPFDSAESPSFCRPAAAGVQNAALSLPKFGETEAACATSPHTSELSLLQPGRDPVFSEPETSNLIEFPRSAVIPVFRGSELAEPVFDRPRIVEAPEVVPAPPALGGMLIEPAPQREVENTAVLPHQTASFARRMLAAGVDLLVLTIALAGFVEIFRRLNPVRPPVPLIVVGLLSVTAMLWPAYEFLFVLYTGATPGWRMARLRLATFDGSPVRRGLRRWRVLASFLSAFSLGLGYLWGILDEDGLCWHDRITHTCLESAPPK